MNSHSNPPTVDVLIPARDEEAALSVMLKEFDRHPLRRIVVVDNGSSDRTAEVAREHDCLVVSCPEPGYGRACLAGMAFIRRDPPDVIVFLDGDRSDDPAYLPRLFQPILDDDYDFVLGSRAKGRAEKGSLSATQVFGNALATRLMKWFWKTNYSDLGPFRAIRWSCLERLAMRDTNFGWTIEMQIKAAVLNLRIKEIAVPYRKRIGVSKISGTLSGCVKAGYKILYTIFKYRFLNPAPGAERMR